MRRAMQNAPLRMGLFDLAAPAAGRICFAAALIISIAMIGPLIVDHHPRPFAADFNHLWTAGKAWAMGRTPYSAEHSALFDQFGLIHTHAVAPPFFYPPHSILLFGPLGFMSPAAACFVFALVNLGALVVSSVLAADILRDVGVKASRLFIASLHAIAIVALWNAGVVIFAHNVATLIVYLAILLALRGAQTGAQAPIAAGVFFALISPQISAPFVLALLMLRETRAGAAVGGVAVGAFTLLGLAPGGFFDSTQGFFANLAVYSGYPENAHSNQSGLGFFVEKLFGFSLSTPTLLLLSAATLLAVRSRLKPGDARAPFEFAGFALVVGLFFIPSLNHYYIVVTTMAAAYVARARLCSLFAVAALVIHMRAWDILAALDGLSWFHGRRNAATIDSIAVTLMLAAAAAALAPRLQLPFRRAEIGLTPAAAAE